MIGNIYPFLVQAASTAAAGSPVNGPSTSVAGQVASAIDLLVTQ